MSSETITTKDGTQLVVTSMADKSAEQAAADKAKDEAAKAAAAARDAEIAARKLADEKRAKDCSSKMAEIVDFWQTSTDMAKSDFIRLGGMCAEYVQISLVGIESNRKNVRSAAIKALEYKLEGIDAEGVDVNRAIGVYHLCRLLGPTASTLAVGALKGMLSLIERDPATETWHIIPQYEASLRDIYNRLSNKQLTGREVRVEVQRTLGKESAEDSKGEKDTVVENKAAKGEEKAPKGETQPTKAAKVEPAKPSVEAYVLPQARDAAAAVSKIAEHTGERAKMFRLLGQVLGKGDFEQLVAGLVDSIKADAKRKKVWTGLQEAMVKQQAEFKAAQPAPAQAERKAEAA